jgi:uncharacterized phiE125 gp8 family phage protein
MAGVLALTGSPTTITELFTTSEVKEYLRVPDPSPTDSAFDAELELMIAAAREAAEGFQGRDLVQKQWDLILDTFDQTQIKLREPLDSVESITYKDSGGTTTTLTVNSQYIADLKRHFVQCPYGESWPSFTPWPSSAVTIRFTSGGTAARHLRLLKMAMLQLIEVWFTGKAATGEVPGQIEKLLMFGRKDEP